MDAPQLRWHIITDQRIVGTDSLQFAGEPYVYGPEQFDLDLDSTPPRFRFKTVPVETELSYVLQRTTTSSFLYLRLSSSSVTTLSMRG